MTRSLKTWLVVVLAGVVVVALGRSFEKHLDEEKRGGSQIVEKIMTVCIGRFLIDMPAEALYELHGSRIDGFDIVAFEESDAGFQERVLARKAQIEATTDRFGKRDNLEVFRKVKNDHGVWGHIFVHGRDVTEGQSSDGLTVERYRYESVSVEALVHVDGISIDVSAPDYDPESIRNLTKLIAQIAPNLENRIPIEHGFCIDRAFVRDPLSADQGEQITMVARLPNRPDILFNMILAAGTEPDREGLLQRAAESSTRLTDAQSKRVKTLRAEKRVIGGIIGEELVERFLENEGTVVHSFWWEVNGTQDNVFVPHLVFRMDTGHSDNGPVRSSLSDLAALRLWDKIASSIRLRPISARNVTQHLPPLSPTKK
ncbi:hypothetical protein MasN3_24320 [Massilia varians]|uniref:Tle cognate immunity protein 4 C-terminal domain-containing protein n=1 Tax=Massilia varians TaxID=457921 RepID=A0ABN6TEF8_9BURK|nr:T6SS immunity protein Tli4 family protein [Massilia varians]BDT58938.1 hypothetical protein MasN3_24320 [Massilia varians]